MQTVTEKFNRRLYNLIKEFDPYPDEIMVLEVLAKDFDKLELSKENMQAIAVGMYNTYFSHISDDGLVEDALFELFLYVMNLFIQFEKEKQFSTTMLNFQSLLSLSMRNEKRSQEQKLCRDNLFSRRLSNKVVRL